MIKNRNILILLCILIATLVLNAEDKKDYSVQKEKLKKQINIYNNKIKKTKLSITDLRKMSDSLESIKSKIENLKAEGQNQINENRRIKSDTIALNDTIKKLKKELRLLRDSLKKESGYAEAYEELAKKLKLEQEAGNYILKPMHKVSLDVLCTYKETIEDVKLLSLIEDCIKDKQAYDEVFLNREEKKYYNSVSCFQFIIGNIDKNRSKYKGQKLILENKRELESKENVFYEKTYINKIQYMKKLYNEYSELLLNNPNSSRIKDIEDEVLSINIE